MSLQKSAFLQRIATVGRDGGYNTLSPRSETSSAPQLNWIKSSPEAEPALEPTSISSTSEQNGSLQRLEQLLQSFDMAEMDHRPIDPPSTPPYALVNELRRIDTIPEEESLTDAEDMLVSAVALLKEVNKEATHSETSDCADSTKSIHDGANPLEAVPSWDNIAIRELEWRRSSLGFIRNDAETLPAADESVAVADDVDVAVEPNAAVAPVETQPTNEPKIDVKPAKMIKSNSAQKQAKTVKNRRMSNPRPLVKAADRRYSKVSVSAVTQASKSNTKSLIPTMTISSGKSKSTARPTSTASTRTSVSASVASPPPSAQSSQQYLDAPYSVSYQTQPFYVGNMVLTEYPPSGMPFGAYPYPPPVLPAPIASYPDEMIESSALPLIQQQEMPGVYADIPQFLQTVPNNFQTFPDAAAMMPVYVYPQPQSSRPMSTLPPLSRTSSHSTVSKTERKYVDTHVASSMAQYRKIFERKLFADKVRHQNLNPRPSIPPPPNPINEARLEAERRRERVKAYVQNVPKPPKRLEPLSKKPSPPSRQSSNYHLERLESAYAAQSQAVDQIKKELGLK